MPFKEPMFVLLLLALIIPYQALLTPLFLMFSDLGLTNSLVGLAIVHTAIQLPFSLYVMRNSFEAVPRELEEAAMIDGAGSLQILRRIFLPAVVPAIITVVLFAFIMSWNEFLGALVMMTDGVQVHPPADPRQRPHGERARGHRLGDAAGRDHDLDHPLCRGVPAAAALLRVRAAHRSGEVTSTALPVQPSAAAATARPRRGRDHRWRVGAAPAGQQRGHPGALPRLDGAAGWVDNFRHAADGTIVGNHQGMMFADSDVYKLMEAMAWEVGRSGRRDADERFGELTAVIAPAQEPDGYLNTVFGRPGQPPRYSDLEWGHELYNDGHLLQAAVARAADGGAPTSSSTSPGGSPTTCARRSPTVASSVGGHPEIELGLVELARVTGEQRYLDQAALFIERRGTGTLGEIPFGQAYFQDDVPIRDAAVFRGHAVRAMYLAAAAVDVAVETGDDELLGRVIAQWEATIARRTYLTGGMGSQHTGEAFGDDFVLPPDRAYSETCAGIGSVMLAWRLLLATGEHRFADLIERTLYNVVATSPAPDGRHFFYANPLHQRVPGSVPSDDVESKRASSSLREPWFVVSCCPTNVARTLASLAAYLATADSAGLQIHQYADSRIRTTLGDSRRVGVELATGYPDDGTVTVRVTETDGQPWALTLRVPSWADGAELVDGDERRPVTPGTVVVERPFPVGDEVTLNAAADAALDLARPADRCHPRLRGGRAGPLVLCAESVDLPGQRHVDLLRVDPSVPPRDRDGSVVVAARFLDPAGDGWPYAAADAVAVPVAADVLAVPRHPPTTRGPIAVLRRCASGSPLFRERGSHVARRGRATQLSGGGFLQAVADGVAETDGRRQDGDHVGAAMGIGVTEFGVEVAGVPHEVSVPSITRTSIPGAQRLAAAVASIGRSTRCTRARGA